MNGIKIRQAVGTDFPAIVECQTALIEEEGSPIPLKPDWKDYVWRDVDAVLCAPNAFVIVAEHDGAVVGTIIGVVSSYPSYAQAHGLVYGLYVRPERRGGRIAHALIMAARSWLSDLGVKCIAILQQNRTGARLRPYYARMGFTSVQTTLVIELEG